MNNITAKATVGKIELKRAYEEPKETGGVRILVHRLWPRGLTKKKARIDLWLEEIAPSTELRKWSGHEAEKWSRFRGRYRAELKHRPAEVELIRNIGP
jgi:uncharacterized protein YeaO (DUF488 family)